MDADPGYIAGELFDFALRVGGLAFLGLMARFAAAKTDSGYRKWDRPATKWEKTKCYSGCLLVAFFAASYCGHIRHGKHQLDDEVVTFICVATAACYGASVGLQKERAPPKTIEEALWRVKGANTLVHHVPTAERHLEQAKEFQAKVDADMARLVKAAQEEAARENS